jgi:hypothetical protein
MISNEPCNSLQLTDFNCFNICHLNVRCLKQNIHLINNYFMSDEPDIFIFTETWSTKDDVQLYVPDNYNLSSFFCRKDSIRGGVSIFAKKNLSLKPYDITFCIEKCFECCCNFLKIDDTNIVFLGIYRSPSGSFDLFIRQLDQCLTNVFQKFSFKSIFFLGGDLNINFLNNNIQTNVLFDVLNSFGFTMNYNEPTRVQGRCHSGIDYLLSTLTTNQFYTSVIHSNISDHYHQILSVSKSIIGLSCLNTQFEYTKRIFSQKNISKFNDIIPQININNFYKMFTEYFNECFPRINGKSTHTKINKIKIPYLVNFSRFLRDQHAEFKANNLPLSSEYKNLLKIFKELVIHERIKKMIILYLSPKIKVKPLGMLSILVSTKRK